MSTVLMSLVDVLGRWPGEDYVSEFLQLWTCSLFQLGIGVEGG